MLFGYVCCRLLSVLGVCDALGPLHFKTALRDIAQCALEAGRPLAANSAELRAALQLAGALADSVRAQGVCRKCVWHCLFTLMYESSELGCELDRR